MRELKKKRQKDCGASGNKSPLHEIHLRKQHCNKSLQYRKLSLYCTPHDMWISLICLISFLFAESCLEIWIIVMRKFKGHLVQITTVLHNCYDLHNNSEALPFPELHRALNSRLLTPWAICFHVQLWELQEKESDWIFKVNWFYAIKFSGQKHIYQALPVERVYDIVFP